MVSALSFACSADSAKASILAAVKVVIAQKQNESAVFMLVIM
jgi:hypothetical protein